MSTRFRRDDDVGDGAQFRLAKYGADRVPRRVEQQHARSRVTRSVDRLRGQNETAMFDRGRAREPRVRPPEGSARGRRRRSDRAQGPRHPRSAARAAPNGCQASRRLSPGSRCPGRRSRRSRATASRQPPGAARSRRGCPDTACGRLSSRASRLRRCAPAYRSRARRASAKRPSALEPEPVGCRRGRC